MGKKSRENGSIGTGQVVDRRVGVIAGLIQNGGLVRGLAQLMPRAQGPFNPGSEGYLRLTTGAEVNIRFINGVSDTAEQVVEQCLPIVTRRLRGGCDGVDVIGKVREAVYRMDATFGANPQMLAENLIARMAEIRTDVVQLVEAQKLQRRFVEAGGVIPEPEKVIALGDEYGLPPVEEKILNCGWRVGGPKSLQTLEESGKGVPLRDLINLVKMYSMRRVLAASLESGPGRGIVLISAGVGIVRSPDGWQEVAAEFTMASTNELYNMRFAVQKKLRSSLNNGKGLGDQFDWEKYFEALNQGVVEWKNGKVGKIAGGRNK